MEIFNLTSRLDSTTERITETRGRIALIATTANVDALAATVMELAELDGAARIYTIAARLLDLDTPPTEVRARIASELVRGADDDWSGRAKGDVRRATFDGIRKAAERVFGWLDDAEAAIRTI